MKNILLIAALLTASFCIQPTPIERPTTHPTTVTVERPTMNLPDSLRQENWLGNEREGSCVHAATVSLLRWQNRFKMAEHWRNTYGNGEGPSGLDDKLTAEGVRFVETVYGDVKFLEWAMRTRRGCGVVIRGGTHFVTLVALDNKQACVMDNNDVHNYRWMPRETFLAEWRASEGWAVAILGSPLAPLPY